MTAVLSLGSNRGDRVGHLAAALEVIGQVVAVERVSSLWETAAVGVTDQAPFLNACALVSTSDAELALTAAHAAEQARGRLRSQRWGPRTLDADVVAVDAQACDDPRLTLPHPRAHERAFVLAPWAELDPDAVLPGRGPVVRLLAAVADQQVTRVRRWPWTGFDAR